SIRRRNLDGLDLEARQFSKGSPWLLHRPLDEFLLRDLIVLEDVLDIGLRQRIVTRSIPQKLKSTFFPGNLPRLKPVRGHPACQVVLSVHADTPGQTRAVPWPRDDMSQRGERAHG